MLQQSPKGLCFQAVRIIHGQQEPLSYIEARGELVFQLTPEDRGGSLKIKIEA